MDVMFAKLVFWHWFALAVILMILDVTIGANFFFVWCGISAAVVGILMLVIPNMTWEFQFLIFGIGIMTSLVIWRQYLKKMPKVTDQPGLNRRAERYIGRVFDLDEAIENGRGKVRVDDTTWRVQGEDLPVGTKVKVIGVDGTVLKVEKV
ncbi:MAG: NfeD family protein [Gammaproteobacteria bacterium]|jgi:membrane protein implicated in regulation of membrane protease activity|nr:NfeD family protein [Gammaproteobacteria bacterium]